MNTSIFNPLRLLGILFFLPILLLFFSCNKEEKESPGNESLAKKVTGIIKLPTGTNIDVNSLKVTSGISSSDVKGGEFTIDTLNYSSSIILTNTGELLMMGYNYPSQPNGDITAESTVLAMMMNTPIMLTAPEALKSNVIANLHSDPVYKTVVDEVSKLIVAGKSFAEVDSSNMRYINAVQALFKNVSSKRTTGWRDEPVVINRASKLVGFTNGGVASVYVVGIYKNDVLNKTLTIDGLKFLPTSLSDIYNGIFGSTLSAVESQEYNLDGDGSYKIKVRSGAPNSTHDGSKEAWHATTLNLRSAAADIISGVLPLQGPCLNKVKENLATSITQMINSGGIINDPALNNVEKMGSYMLLLTETVINTTTGLVESCGKVSNSENTNAFLKKITDWFNFTRKVLVVSNVTVHGYHWLNAKPIIDTCYKVNGNSIGSCSEPNSISLISGNNQKWFADSSLPIPLTVEVKDQENKIMAGVEVTWEVATGGGKLSLTKSTTGTNGRTNVGWKIGKDPNQRVVASIKKSDGSHIAGSPIMFNATAITYELQIGTYNPNYSLITPVVTLKNGDPFNTPNYVSRMVRLLANGSPVRVGQFGLEWAQVGFGTMPTSSQDIINDNYPVSVRDASNNINVTIRLKTVLSNRAYALIAGRTITVKYQGYTETKYTFSNTPSFSLAISPNFVECQSTTLNKDIIGAVLIHASSNPLLPGFIMINADGSLTANSFYDCPEFAYWEIY